MPRQRKDPPRPISIADDTPLFTPAIVASLLGIDQRKLRTYELAGLVHPKRTPKGRSIYSQNDLKRLEVVEMLASRLGINYSGIKVITGMMEELEKMGINSREILQRLMEDSKG